MSINNLLSSIDSEIATLTKARALLAGLAVNSPSAKPKRKMSKAARMKIAAAQRKRWAAVKKPGKK
jgi:hypothetical protein